jgi:hypothetical protein
VSGPVLEEAVALVLEERTGCHCLFVVLAAGLRPVMAPVSANDGNVAELRARCDRLGIPPGVVAFADPACRPRLEALRDRFEPWIRVDLHHYAEPPGPSSCAACWPAWVPPASVAALVLSAAAPFSAFAEPAIRSSSRVGILSVLAVGPHAHATLGATGLHSCHGLLPLRVSSSRVS